jgi:hypothetical protein
MTDKMGYSELVTVYVPRTHEEYIVAMPVLDEHGIYHFDKNATLYRGATGGMLAVNAPIGPIEVQVRKEDVERANELLQDVLSRIRQG